MNDTAYIGYGSEPLAVAKQVTKIGGLPEGFDFARWPVCRTCGTRQAFLLQLDLNSPIKLVKKYQWAYVFVCGDIYCEPFLEDSGGNTVILVDGANPRAQISNVSPSHLEASIVERHVTFHPYTSCEDDWLGTPDLFVGIAPHYDHDLVCLHCRDEMKVLAQLEYDGHACFITMCQAECCDAAACFMW